MTTVGVLTKPKFPEIEPILKELIGWLRDRAKEVVLEPETATLVGESVPADKSRIATHSDVVLVLGGDGTMLSAARLLGEHSVPILGVNLGGLGFLTETTLDQLYPSLEKIFAHEYQTEERLMLQATIHRRKDNSVEATVLNDVVISKGPLARMIATQIQIDGSFVTNVRGDGIIFSTPTGSTAYSLSAGGPLLVPSLEAFIITPICPHTLTHRPLLVPSNVTTQITVTSREGAMATLDGQVGVELEPEEWVTMCASPHRTRLIRFPDRTYFSTLRSKLKWGDG